jgi:ABC-type xylose transport system permease subunit
MQAGSFGLVAGFVLILALAIGLSVIIAAPILAVPFFIVGFGAFLVWRGKRRAETELGGRSGSRVPTTEEAAADPAGDSSVGDAARAETRMRGT